MNDPLRIALVAFCAAALRAIVAELWAWYKRRQSGHPVNMRLKNGVHVPWGPVERLQAIGRFLGDVFIIYLALLVGFVIVLIVRS